MTDPSQPIAEAAAPAPRRPGELSINQPPAPAPEPAPAPLPTADEPE